MAKVRILNYFNGMPVTARPGDEIELDDRYLEGLVKTGYVELVTASRRSVDEVEPEPPGLKRRGGR